MKEALLLAMALLAGACSAAAPRAVALGEEPCGYCRMEIVDARFATQVLTRTGKSTVFDTVECMAGYVRAMESSALASAWVTDPDAPGVWVRAEDAGYLVDGSLLSPMGRAVAFASPAAAAAARARFGGTTVSWDALRTDSAGISSHESH